MLIISRNRSSSAVSILVVNAHDEGIGSLTKVESTIIIAVAAVVGSNTVIGRFGQGCSGHSTDLCSFHHMAMITVVVVVVVVHNGRHQIPSLDVAFALDVAFVIK